MAGCKLRKNNVSNAPERNFTVGTVLILLINMESDVSLCSEAAIFPFKGGPPPLFTTSLGLMHTYVDTCTDKGYSFNTEICLSELVGIPKHPLCV